MMTQLMTVMTAVICLSSHTCVGQRWGAARRWNLRTPYNIPIAEPEPEPEPFGRRLSHRRIPIAEPGPFSRRLSRRLISKQRTIKSLIIPSTPSPVLTTTQRSSTVTTPLQTSLTDRRTNILKLLNKSFPNFSPSEDLQFDDVFSETFSPNPPTMDTAQLMIPTIPPPVLTTTDLKLIIESFPSPEQAEDLQFDEIFSDTSSSNPWAIDTAQFEIVPAVPGDYTLDVVVENVKDDSKENNDFLTNIPVPRQFSPVPAVPDVTTAPDDVLARQPKNTLRLSDEVENSLEEGNVSSQTKQKNMKDKGSCLERCVQQFCLPEEDLSMFSDCVDKCKTFCF